MRPPGARRKAPGHRLRAQPVSERSPRRQDPRDVLHGQGVAGLHRLRRIDLGRIDEYRPRIQEFAAELKRKFRLSRVILFGSFAREDVRANVHEMSDIDMVIVGDVPGESLFDRIGAVTALTRLPVEPWVYTEAEWKEMGQEGSSFAEEVLDTGVDL